MIDPIATVIIYLTTTPELVALEGRIAAKHKFGMTSDAGVTTDDRWTLGQQALRIQPAGGEADIATPRATLDLTATCYGGSQQEAMAVALQLTAACRRAGRTMVVTDVGTALMYYVLVSSAPMFGFEPVGEANGSDMVTLTLRTAIAECPVGN